MLTLDNLLNRVAEKLGATVNPDFSSRFEGPTAHSNPFENVDPPAGSILCIMDSSKMSTLSLYSGWEISVECCDLAGTPSWKLYINRVLAIQGINRKNLEEIRGMVYRALIGRLRAASTGKRGV